MAEQLFISADPAGNTDHISWNSSTAVTSESFFTPIGDFPQRPSATSDSEPEEDNKKSRAVPSMPVATNGRWG